MFLDLHVKHFVYQYYTDDYASDDDGDVSDDCCQL